MSKDLEQKADAYDRIRKIVSGDGITETVNRVKKLYTDSLLTPCDQCEKDYRHRELRDGVCIDCWVKRFNAQQEPMKCGTCLTELTRQAADLVAPCPKCSADLRDKLSAAEAREAEAGEADSDGETRAELKRIIGVLEDKLFVSRETLTAEREARRKANAACGELRKVANAARDYRANTIKARRHYGYAAVEFLNREFAARDRLFDCVEALSTPHPGKSLLDELERLRGQLNDRMSCTGCGSLALVANMNTMTPDPDGDAYCSACIELEQQRIRHKHELERLRQLAKDTDAKWDEKSEVWTLPFYRSHEGYTVAAHIPVSDWKHQRQLAAFELERLRKVAEAVGKVLASSEPCIITDDDSGMCMEVEHTPTVIDGKLQCPIRYLAQATEADGKEAE